MWQDTQSEQPVPESLRLIAIEQGVPPERFEVMEEMRTAGDVGSEVISPLQVFVDASVRSIADLAPDQAVYIAKIRTIGWIEENYPEVDAESLTKAAENKDKAAEKKTRTEGTLIFSPSDNNTRYVVMPYNI